MIYICKKHVTYQLPFLFWFLTFKDSAFSFLGGTADSFASYASIPHYISSDVRSLFMENSEYTSFDLRQPDRVQIRIESDKIQGIYI
jgi:hypothetical protein